MLNVDSSRSVVKLKLLTKQIQVKKPILYTRRTEVKFLNIEEFRLNEEEALKSSIF